ncbi:uncharacterized protein CLAFUR5_03638 [Fulvia fulva]|uniref:YAG7-like dimerisation domain-containing protein n=1 Tax=Passalora fulva TaxID=5499 RepID=A0A9Q8L954_PASFU|nr:uncharacterized protein CLAFUR5_03638 [Fulvia fulva]KAK4632650.1 hypothetical protein CLAFUR0_03651 [Fulvia fulva]UJO13221.1 hypothetical protein CLAFUR5_03638 [Fulvia fulva]
MAAAAVENPVNVQAESKSARRKKAKAEAAANGTHQSTAAVPEAESKDASVAPQGDDAGDHPYLRELQKQIRNVNKKLTLMQKVDSIVAENPGVSVEDLVAQRKINNDQKAQLLKKPQLQAQVQDLTERYQHYRSFDSEYQTKFTKQREELSSQHEKALEKIKEEARVEALSSSASELRKKLLTFSQFLRAAAAKRAIEDETDTDESRAFEGALLLVYGGDQKAVETAVNIIEGAGERVPSVEGIELPITFAQVKQASVGHAPFQNEEAWAQDVAQATSGQAPAELSDVPTATSDPTIANAGLTELEAPRQNGVPAETLTEPSSAAAISSGDAGNQAGERWDTTSAGAQQGGLDESYEIVPRPSEEVDVPAPAATQPQSTSWADEPVHEAAAGVGNQAGESWNVKAPGEQTNNSRGAEPAAANGWAEQSEAAAAADDGFSEVPGHTRGGRGGHRGRGGDGGEFRGRGGRGGGFRGNRGGDGEFRGRGRGAFRGNRGGEGEGRGGRGGRGRGGPRGGGAEGGNAARS